MTDQHLVFLSYASPDEERVYEWYDYLLARGFNVWMDKRNLKGGQNWDFEIKRALKKATVIVVFLSSSSVDRRGYAQREIRSALDQAQDKLVDDIYLVPVLLDNEVPIPGELDRIQVLRPEDGDQFEAAADAISTQLERLGEDIARLQGESEVRWTTTTYRDRWDGLPGYEATYQLPRFSSDTYPHVSEITDVLRGWLAAQIMSQRHVKFNQMPDHHNFGQRMYSRQNSWEATCGEPKIKERILTILYNVWWYGAGAAHPNYGFNTFSFTLDPLTQIADLRNIFINENVAFPVIQSAVRISLALQNMNVDVGVVAGAPIVDSWVLGGTESWDDLSNFVFSEEGIEFHFGAYHVAPYAAGPQSVVVSYAKLAKLMTPYFASALGIEHLCREDPWPFNQPEAASEGTSDEAATEYTPDN